jgi:oxygen-dependent protoporphyrinogen oxidase
VIWSLVFVILAPMVGIIGAGISGLTTAYFLQKAGIDYMLLEASDRAGGFIRTKNIDNYILDCGPNSILCDEEIINFFKELGLENDILSASSSNKSRYILKKGKYRKLPGTPLELFSSCFFSWKTKLKILNEPFKKPAFEENETLGHFFERRFGREIVDYALNPFVSGIYAGDPDELILEETFPMLANYEKEYGSVLKGLIKNAGTRKKSLNFKNGMQCLPDKLSKVLKNIKLNQKITSISKKNDEFNITAEENGVSRHLMFKELIIATPAYVAADLLNNLFPEPAHSFSKINYSPMSLVHTAFDKKDVSYNLCGFGGLNPKIENQFSAGCLWTSSVFKNRAPESKVLFTSFVGGRQYMENAKQEAGFIKREITKELCRHFGINTSPLFQEIIYWEKALPQYDCMLVEAKKHAKDLEKENIFICSNWYNGISLSDCIKNGKIVTEKCANIIGSLNKHDYI